MSRKNRSQQLLRRRHGVVRKVALGIGSLLGLVLVASFVFSEMGVVKYLELRQHVEKLEAEIHDLETANHARRAEINKVQHDPARIEELARDRLGYVKRNETVYQVMPEGARPQ